MLTAQLARKLDLKIQGSDAVVLSASGERIPLLGEAKCDIIVEERLLPAWNLFVVPQLPADSSLLIGVDAIKKLGGFALSLSASGRMHARFPRPTITSAVQVIRSAAVIEDPDFRAEFDGQRWEVSWTWKRGPPELKNRVAQYAVNEDILDAYNTELTRWMEEGWLVPCDQPQGGIIPLLAVHQAAKNKVRPVLDYRELNDAVQSHTADCEVCPETLRRWRLMGDRLGVVDLKNAYLQLHVRRDLQEFQVVRIGEQHYRLTRLGFGLASAPRIMAAVVRHILSSDSDISAATDHYVDDIVVDTDLVSMERVIEHLRQYGLVTKPPETLNGTRVLGLQLSDTGQGRIRWMRSRSVPQLSDDACLNRRELFSFCGCLIGHYPVAGWLRVACSFIKRYSEGQGWRDGVGDRVTAWLREVMKRLRRSDPVQGFWAEPDVKKGRVWCDASSLATGVALQIGDAIVEDAAWLRKKGDATHVNVAELDAVIQGINLAIRWNMEIVEVVTDSATVRGWMSSVLTGSHRVRSHGLAEMLIKRRLALVAELIQAYGLSVSVKLVPSEDNKADILTRVPRAWLQELKRDDLLVCSAAELSLEELHRQHHFGVQRTLHLARQVNSNVTREEVERVVKACGPCNSIDPTPMKWKKGHLHVTNCWERVAIDTTHYGGEVYLTLIDCGPSRYTVWRRINSESASVVVAVLQSIFIEFGPPTEILLDNSATFRSAEVQQLFQKWAVRARFRCAYRPSGNGLVERIHRTVKRVAARSGISPKEATFWYNLAPMDGNSESAPSTVLFSSNYRWRNPSSSVAVSLCPSSGGGGPFCVGDLVYVKPSPMRCTTQWPTGRVTAILSEHAVEVDGIPRHVADCRPSRGEPLRPEAAGDDSDDDEEDEDGGDASHVSGVPEEEESGVQNPWEDRLRQNVRPPDRFVPS
jgi:transposase InsO family protein/ribonuclease HI